MMTYSVMHIGLVKLLDLVQCQYIVDIVNNSYRQKFISIIIIIDHNNNNKIVQSNLGASCIAILVADLLIATAHNCLTVFARWRQRVYTSNKLFLCCSSTAGLSFLLSNSGPTGQIMCVDGWTAKQSQHQLQCTHWSAPVRLLRPQVTVNGPSDACPTFPGKRWRLSLCAGHSDLHCKKISVSPCIFYGKFSAF